MTYSRDLNKLPHVIGCLQEVQYGLRSDRPDLARRNLIEATSSLQVDLSGHADDRGFPDRPGITIRDRELELIEIWGRWSMGKPGAAELFAAEVEIILARLQEVVARMRDAEQTI